MRSLEYSARLKAVALSSGAEESERAPRAKRRANRHRELRLIDVDEVVTVVWALPASVYIAASEEVAPRVEGATFRKSLDFRVRYLPPVLATYDFIRGGATRAVRLPPYDHAGGTL